jgi:membrane-associated phospholipid phosphatase
MGKKKHKKQHKLPKDASWIEQMDIRFIHGLRDFLDHPAARAAGWVGNVGDQPPMLALGALTLVGGLAKNDGRALRAGVGMIAAHLLATGAKTVVKRSIDRTRPKELLETGGYHSGPGTEPDPALQSFPSGHTAGVVAVARAFGRQYPEHRAAATAVASAVSALQVPRRAHFPTDILVGAAIGYAAELVTHRLIGKAAKGVLA